MKVTSNIKCSKAQKLMSPYIDSMVDPGESERLEFHLETCEPCRRQLQSYISMRSMLACVEPVRPPADLVLDTRVRLSHARSGKWLDRLDARLEKLRTNVLKPLAIPAVSGIVLTALSFSLLLGHLALNFRAQILDSSLAAREQPVRTTDQTLLSGVGAVDPAGSDVNDWREPVSVQANVGVEGRVYGITFIGGAQSPAIRRWINNLLYPAQFAPATRLGKPVNSTIILSFVNVRS